MKTCGDIMFGVRQGVAVLLAVLALPLCASPTEDSPYNHCLYYEAPASIWEETLPLGNGRLGMMPDGGITHERIVLNEISMWSGSESDYGNPDAARNLPEIRQLLFEGKNKEAQELMYTSFVPKKQKTDGRYGAFQVLGFLDITQDFAGATADNVQDYRRELSLRDAVACTSFCLGDVDFRREYFTSRDHDLMLVRLSASRTGALSFSASLSRPERALVTAVGNVLLMDGQLDSGNPEREGLRFHVAMRVLSKDGKVRVSENGITLNGGTTAWIVVSAATSFEGSGTDFPGEHYVEFADGLLDAGIELLEDEECSGDVFASHIAAHRDLYDRVNLVLPASPEDVLPTNLRLQRFAAGRHTPSLAVLYYNYGRYLLISSTRPGSLPPNLQGLWANELQTPWNGDYHTNINIQMNHWPLEQAGLSELYQPLTTLIERLIPSGEETARTFYGENAQGWVLHMMTNVWNYTAPGEHPSWGATNTGGAWLCAHLWEHYLYTQDHGYLQRIYPIMKGAAEFFHSTIVREPKHGWLVTAPTSSPENSFYLSGDSLTSVSVCMGPTMDVQLLTELYTNVIAAARLLNRDEAFALVLERDLKDFPPMQVSKEGYLQEWLEDYRETDVHHRHVSHLYGLHPGNQISPYRTPGLAEACRATLNRRGDGGTGWSRAWKVNFWARLGDGNRAWKLFCNLLDPAVDPETGQHGSGTFPNLFCSHPPFQLDGNFGGAAGIGEMLLQSHEGFIQLLPALPDSWSNGGYRGMRVRGGAAIDLDWHNGKARQAKITALSAGTFVLKMPDGATQAKLAFSNGQIKSVAHSMITVDLQKGESCRLSFQ